MCVCVCVCVQCTHMWCVGCAKALALHLPHLGLWWPPNHPMWAHTKIHWVWGQSSACVVPSHMCKVVAQRAATPHKMPHVGCFAWGHAPIVWGVLGPRWVGGVVALL